MRINYTSQNYLKLNQNSRSRAEIFVLLKNRRMISCILRSIYSSRTVNLPYRAYILGTKGINYSNITMYSPILWLICESLQSMLLKNIFIYLFINMQNAKILIFISSLIIILNSSAPL